VRILGELDDVFTVVSNFLIKPYVARVSARPSYSPDPGEVAEVIEVPLRELGNPGIYWTEERIVPGGERRDVHFFKPGDHVIWGATARILKLFLESEFSRPPTANG
jgi:hypothetical protein